MLVKSSVRDFRPEDFEALWRIDQECFPPEIAYSRVELLYYMHRRNAFTLVAENPDAPEIVGFTVVEYSTAKRSGHIITIDVRETARRTGTGSLLMERAEAKLHAVKCTAVFLETAIDNKAAIAFYKRRGYFVLKTLPRYYSGELDAFLMGKKLERAPEGAR